MALLPTPEASQGIWGAVKDALGLFSDTNKAGNGTLDENGNPLPQDPYESKLDDTKILQLVAQWKRLYTPYYTDIEKGQKLSFDYWVGKHRLPDQSSALGNNQNTAVIVDNLIFEAVETFLPIATRANPEPLVTADPSDLGQELAKQIKTALAHEADTQNLRRKLAKATRGWLLNRLGVLKVTWNPAIKQIETEVINSKRLIFDIDGYIDEKCEFVGEYIGEKKKATAEVLIDLFPKKREAITKKAKGKLATKLDYYEWYYRATDVFYTLDDDTVLGKFKNPNWNYDGETSVKDPETLEPVTNTVPGTNHLKEASTPYRFLAIFSTGEQPHDNTSLVLQNIATQDAINRREQQIEQNVQGMNNGIVVGNQFTEEQASQAASAMRRGMAIRVPTGDVTKAVLFPNKPALPGDVFNHLRDSRQELRNIFGVNGSTAQGVNEQDTVRGKLLVNQMDSSRIGGGISEFIEQLADSIYNLWVQMMFVHYEEEHYITAVGTVGAAELITIKNDRFPQLKTLVVTVKDGSLVPKDPLTQRNEAIDLWSANAIDPRTLYKKLDWPDPDEATNQLILWQMVQKGAIQPQMYLPTFAVAGQTPNQTQGAPMPGQPLPGEQPGTGGPPVSAVGASQPGGITPPTPEATQSQQLMQSAPLPKA